MNNSRFVILTGHLNDYPISDLVGILRHQRKTGRLVIEYDKGPAHLFFYEGDLVDAKMNELTGLHAVCFALAQPPASFNFNPLIQPTQRTIEDSLQRTVSELFGCWDDSIVEIPVAATAIPMLPEKTAEPEPAAPSATLPAYEVERLALPAAVVSSSRRPVSLFVMTAAGLATLGVSTAIALSGGFRNSQDKNVAPSVVERSITAPAAVDRLSDSQHASAARNMNEGSSARSRSKLNNETSSQSTRTSQRNNERANTVVGESPKPTDVGESSSKSDPESVTVVMEIENGRVLRASIANPKLGLDSYEALALRIARQRRYSSQQSGRETVKIKVSPSDQ
jgi:Domain of unknown function (DUF4388)